MLGQIVIGAIRDALKLLPAEGELVFDVVSAFGIKRALFVGHSQNVQLLSPYADVAIKLEPLLFPIFEKIHPLLRPAKIFQLHLLELA